MRSAVRLGGFVDTTLAYTYSSPDHWSRAVTRTQVGAAGSIGANAKWKATLRLDVDPVYYVSNFYPEPVKKNQQLDFFVRETYLDLAAGPVDLRLGRQQIVWGEMVGLFFADVVSAKDLRDFVLPPFEIIRIPQWAVRAEYFRGDSHFEAVWIPYPSYNDIGKPGAEFYPQLPVPPGFTSVIQPEDFPAHTLSNTNYGLRASTLIRGWDWSAFYYRSMDAAQTFYPQVQLTPTPTVSFQARHDRIWQAGATVAKDFGRAVLKAEAVYTSGRSFPVSTIQAPVGLVRQNALDYVVGVDVPIGADVRVNVQGFQRLFYATESGLPKADNETGASLQIVWTIGKFAPELLWIQGFSPNQGWVRPRVVWNFRQNWSAATGVDVFWGPVTSGFGQFNNRDRVFAEVRYSF